MLLRSRKVRILTERLVLRPPVHGDYRHWAALRETSEEFLRPWEPTWSKDGRTLVFRSRDGRYLYETDVYESPIASTERSLRLGDTRLVAEGPYFVCSEWGRSYDVSSDGRYLMIHDTIPGYEMGQINVVLNWTSEIREKLRDVS